MRNPSYRAIGLAPVIAVALFGSATDHGHAGQARGTLGVAVRVVASCSAALPVDGGDTIGSICPSTSAPLAIMNETVVPEAFPVEAQTAEKDAAETDIHYLTLIY